jgi:hypothetical protein
MVNYVRSFAKKDAAAAKPAGGKSAELMENQVLGSGL